MHPPASRRGRAPSPVIFRARPTEVRILLSIGIVATGLGLAVLGFGAWAWAFATSTYGPAAVGRWANPWFIAAPPLTLIGVGFLLRARRLGNLLVEVHDQGLRLRRGRRVDSLAWASIREIRTRAAPRGKAAFALLDVRSDQGRRLRFNRELARLDLLVDMVKRRAFPGLLEDYRLRFNRGEPLSIGNLLLDVDGVQAGPRRISWAEVRTVEVRAGQLLITAHEPADSRIRVAADRMPNIDVVVQLVRLLGQVP